MTEEVKLPALKSCPFCRSRNLILNGHNNEITDCGDCGASASTVLWNTRADDQAVKELREVIEPISKECELMAYTSAGDPERMENMRWFAQTAGILKKALASTAKWEEK